MTNGATFEQKALAEDAGELLKTQYRPRHIKLSHQESAKDAGPTTAVVVTDLLPGHRTIDADKSRRTHVLEPLSKMMKDEALKRENAKVNECR
jgi:hypothetical protein